MGKWNNRPRKYFHRRDRPPRDDDDYCEPPPDSTPFWGSVDDGVPMWEKKFCSEVGRVPWRKVVDSKMFMYSHSNVLNWDDSAGKEAFLKAKDRFWAEINKHPQDISSPDPDLYIDEIDWNATIDPELLKDIEQSVFIPEGEEMDSWARRRNKRLRYLLSNQSERDNSSEQNESRDHGKLKKTDLQSSGTSKDRTQGWNSTNYNKVDNAWELPTAQSIECNGWKQSGSQWNCGKDENSEANPWEQGCQDVDLVNDEGWGKCADGSWDHNWKQSANMNNSCKSGENNVQGWQDIKKDNNWGRGSWDNNVKDQGSMKATEASGGWRAWNNSFQAEKSYKGDSSWDVSAARRRRNDKGNAWDDNAPCNSDRSWGEWNGSGRKNRDDDAYRTDYRSTSYNNSTRYQGNTNQTGRSWREGNSKKRASFAFEQSW